MEKFELGAGNGVNAEVRPHEIDMRRFVVGELLNIGFHRRTLEVDRTSAGYWSCSLSSWTDNHGYRQLTAQCAEIKLGAEVLEIEPEALNVVLAAYLIEEVCVTNLRGAVTLITSKMVLDGITGLLGAESYQAGMIRTALFAMGYADQTNAISYLRTKLDGTVGTPLQGSDHGVGTIAGPGIANVNANAIPDERTMTQVLNIAYGHPGNNPQPGGFFPAGVNMY